MPPKKKMSNISTAKKDTVNVFGGAGWSDTNFVTEDKSLGETFFQKTRLVQLENIRFYKDNEFRKYKKNRADIAELEESIKLIGLASPILLRENEDEQTGTKYEVLAGSRRFTAFSNLLEKAMKNNDSDGVNRYSSIPAFILPKSMTVDEALRVYEDTNLMHESLDISDMFNHLDAFLEKDSEGKFIRLPEGRINVAKILKGKFDRLGCSYSLAQIKKYVSVWLAEDERLKEEFKNGYLTFNQCYTISQMPGDMQTSVLDKFSKMTEKEVNEYLKAYNLEIKVQKQNRRSVDVINDLDKLKSKINQLTQLNKIDITDEKDRFVMSKEIDEIINQLQLIKTKYE